MLSLLTVALACTSLLAEPPVRSDEFEPVSIHAVELPPAPLPAPVIAEPKNTGCTSARLVCPASSSRSRAYGMLSSSM